MGFFLNIPLSLPRFGLWMTVTVKVGNIVTLIFIGFFKSLNVFQCWIFVFLKLWRVKYACFQTVWNGPCSANWSFSGRLFPLSFQRTQIWSLARYQDWLEKKVIQPSAVRKGKWHTGCWLWFIVCWCLSAYQLTFVHPTCSKLNKTIF